MATRSEMLIRVNMSREAKWIDAVGTDATIVMPSHILETFKKNMASLLAKPDRRYIIDPITYVFSNTEDIEDIEDKQWFSKLAAEYGISMVTDSDERGLSSHTLISSNGPSDMLEELVENVINYQRKTVPEIVKEIAEFIDFESNTAKSSAHKPQWLMPPYFFISSDKSKWLNVNIEAARLAVARRQGKEKVFAPIMLDATCMMNDDVANSIINAYSIGGLDGYMLWPVHLDENSAMEHELSKFVEFVRKLSGSGRPIYSMYGGLLSFMMLKYGMAGVSHSICYGEHKSPFTGRGMVSTVRFYQPDLHSLVPLTRKEEIEQALDLKKCACKHCANMGNSKYDMELAGKHFLEIRGSEVREISDDPDAFLEKLASDHGTACEKDQKKSYVQFYNRLGVWKSVMDGS